MKYEDYKKEDLVFLTKTDWTEEEKKEVLSTFPESRDAEKIREIMKEANRKAELIIDRVSIELREIQEKYRDENKGGN